MTAMAAAPATMSAAPAAAVTTPAATAEAEADAGTIIGRTVIGRATIIATITAIAAAIGAVPAAIRIARIARVIGRTITAIITRADADADHHARICRRRNNRGGGACQHQCTQGNFREFLHLESP